MGGNSFKRWLYLINHQPTLHGCSLTRFFYHRRLLKIQMVGELYYQTKNNRTNKVFNNYQMNTYMHFKLTKSFYNLKRKFWINMWIDIMMGYKKAKHWKEPLFSISYHPSLFTIPNKNVNTQSFFSALLYSFDSFYSWFILYTID